MRVLLAGGVAAAGVLYLLGVTILWLDHRTEGYRRRAIRRDADGLRRQ